MNNNKEEDVKSDNENLVRQAPECYPMFIGETGSNRKKGLIGQKFIPYTVEMMKAIVRPYCRRIKLLKAVPPSQINLATESLILKIGRGTLENLLETEDTQGNPCEGLIAVLAVDKDASGDKNQTFILIPVGNDGKALKLNKPGMYYGEQRWPTIHRTMQDMVGSSGTDPDPTIDGRIEDFFHNTLGI